MRHQKNGRCIMTTSEKAKISATCEANAVSYDKIDFSEIPEITDFSGLPILLDTNAPLLYTYKTRLPL